MHVSLFILMNELFTDDSSGDLYRFIVDRHPSYCV